MKAIPEWSTQECLFLSIPHAKSDWKPYLYEIVSSYQELVKAITPYQKVVLIAPNESDFEPFKRFTNTDFIQIPTNDTWIRDYGAIDVLENDKIISYDFTFNAWGNKFESSLDNSVNTELFAKMGGELRAVDFILEGGSIDFNGEGVMLTTSECLLNVNRNSKFSKQEIDKKLKNLFGLKEIIWLNNGGILGDDTDSHVDTLARFISPNVIAYASCDDENDENYVTLKKMENELKALDYELLPLPIPRKIFFEGKRLGATYVNFIFINDALIVPTYGDEKYDKIALSRLAGALNRKIIGVDARVFIRQNGSLHCSSQNRYLGRR